MSLLSYYETKRPRSYATNWHHKWMCKVLEQAYSERQNAIIEVPPRHGKSELVNVYGPGYWLESHPFSMWGLVTNSDSLAKKFSMACRGLVAHPLEVDRDAQWKVQGLDSLNFTYLAAGIRGQLTGHGFDTVIFDDLLKSGLEAKSDTVRETVWENVASAAMNRLTPDGIVIALQARLHSQDTIGKLLELDHLKFLHLRLPATNDSGGQAWFRDGYSGEEVQFPAYSALWPARYSREKLDEIRATVTPYYWSAQYQQVPSLGDLAFFEEGKAPLYQYPNVERCWLAVDAANTQTKAGSFTAFVCVGLHGRSLKVLGVHRGRWRQDRMADELLGFYQAMARHCHIWPEAVIVERAAAGYGLIDNLSGKLPIVPVFPTGSKEDRAGSVCGLWNRGQVQLPENATWKKAFVEELVNFPLGAYNDQVDSFVHALAYGIRPSEFKPEDSHELREYDGVEQLEDNMDDEFHKGLVQFGGDE